MRNFKEINGIQYMKCGKCGEWFPETDEYFYKHKYYKNGLHVYCRKCSSKISNEYNKKHPKQHNKINKEWRKKNPIKHKIIESRCRAKKRKLGFNIIAEIPFPDEDIKEWLFYHINNKDVVAIPRDIHFLYMGKNRKFMVEQVIAQLYPELKLD